MINADHLRDGGGEISIPGLFFLFSYSKKIVVIIVLLFMEFIPYNESIDAQDNLITEFSLL